MLPQAAPEPNAALNRNPQWQDDRQEQKEDNDEDVQKFDGIAKLLDLAANTLTLTVRAETARQGPNVRPVQNVEVQVAGKAANLADVRAGMRVVVEVSRARQAVVEIEANGPQGKKNAGRNK